jgi:hypothetical protein
MRAAIKRADSSAQSGSSQGSKPKVKRNIGGVAGKTHRCKVALSLMDS